MIEVTSVACAEQQQISSPGTTWPTATSDLINMASDIDRLYGVWEGTPHKVQDQKQSSEHGAWTEQ